MILAFGYAQGEPARADKTFDVRDLTHDTNSDEFKAREREITDYGRTHPSENIAIGCKAGKHRSVVLARRAATTLRTSFMQRDAR